MNILILGVIGLWIVRITGNLFTYISLWFVKEYRYDRMWIHLHTAQGRRLLFAPWKKPPLSPKTVTLFILSGLTLCIIGWQMQYPVFFRLVVLDLLSFPVTAIVVLLLGVPTVIYHEILIYLAVNKLRMHSPMLVIGVTGSYGKTSTKEYISTILSAKYRVLKTLTSKNSAIAVAELVLRELKSDTEVFVVEMGAYQKGEIARMCRIVRPEIGVVTAINAQHQDLFKSLETTMKAKYELIAGLSGRRISVFNADNPRVREMSKWAIKDGLDVRYFTRVLKQDIENRPTVVADNIRVNERGIRFQVRLGDELADVRAEVIGEYQAGNIAGAIATAVAAGLPFTQAAGGACEVRPIPKVMELLPGVNGSVFVNDTFNNNPDAALAALDYLETRSGQKYLVFQPMVELGDFAGTAHVEVGKRAAQVCEAVFLTDDNHYNDFVAGSKQAAPQKQVWVMDPGSASVQLRKLLRPGSTVLFKGKSSEQVFQRLMRS